MALSLFVVIPFSSSFVAVPLALLLGWAPTPVPAMQLGPPHRSLAQLSDEELSRLATSDLAALGSLSLGSPDNGRLLNGVRPPESGLFELVTKDHAYGTAETIASLTKAIRAVQAAHPHTPPLFVGHISNPGGGYLKPHLSHQSGRDADIGYFYHGAHTWYRRATWKSLDVERTWTLVRALLTETDVEFIFIDFSIQALLKRHAQSLGEDPRWLSRVFRGDAERPAIIRHAPGHATHIHVRFFNPLAQTNAQRAYRVLLSHQLVQPVVVYLHHRVRKGETLGRLARRYGTTVRAIQQANGLRSTNIQAKRVYKIPRQGDPAPSQDELRFPPRVLPPPKEQVKNQSLSAGAGQSD